MSINNKKNKLSDTQPETTTGLGAQMKIASRDKARNKDEKAKRKEILGVAAPNAT